MDKELQNKTWACLPKEFRNEVKYEYNRHIGIDRHRNFTKTLDNGVTFREACRKVLSMNGLYLPDEGPRDLFSDMEESFT